MNLLSALLFWSDRLTAGVLIIQPLFTLATKMASMSSLSGAKLPQLRWLLTPGMLSRLDMCLGTPTQVINLIDSMIIHQNALNNNLLYLLDWSSVVRHLGIAPISRFGPRQLGIPSCRTQSRDWHATGIATWRPLREYWRSVSAQLPRQLAAFETYLMAHYDTGIFTDV